MRIGFRVDSSKALGIGHINRSLVLASEFKKSGAKVFFFTSNLNGNQDRLIKDNGFNLIKLNKEEVLQKNYNKNYLNKDALKIIKQIKRKRLELIIIDNYLINERWERKVCKFCKIALIEDYLQRKTYCDYLISYHLGINKKATKLLLNKNCLILNDSQYTIIKKKPLSTQDTTNSKKILVYMGGSDNLNFVIKITKTLSNKIYNKIQFSLLTNRSKVKILKKILKKKNNFKIITRKQKNLYSLANKNKLIISNMGVSMYEFAHANKKIILIPQSKIHKKISSKLKLFKLFKILKSPKDINSKIISDGFKEDNKTVNLRGNIYDGFGAKRIVQFFNQKFRNCKLAKIRDFDKYFLYNLVNDPAVRIASIKKGNIPFQNHEKWFRSKFKNKKNIFYLLKYNNLKIGQIRLEKIKKKYLLDYSISNEFRGFGLGSKMIKLAINKIKNSNVIAQSLVKNFYSNYTLQKAGFKRINLKKNIINYQFIR